MESLRTNFASKNWDAKTSTFLSPALLGYLFTWPYSSSCCFLHVLHQFLLWLVFSFFNSIISDLGIPSVFILSSPCLLLCPIGSLFSYLSPVRSSPFRQSGLLTPASCPAYRSWCFSWFETHSPGFLFLSKEQLPETCTAIISLRSSSFKFRADITTCLFCFPSSNLMAY